MRAPQRFVEFELERAHSMGCCLSGPTIFLGHPTKCRCDDALPARGQGNGGSSPLYNERLGVPIIFLCRAEQPSDADTGAINIQNNGHPIYITILTVKRRAMEISLFIPDSTGSNWCLFARQKRGAITRRCGLVTRHPSSHHRHGFVYRREIEEPPNEEGDHPGHPNDQVYQ